MQEHRFKQVCMLIAIANSYIISFFLLIHGKRYVCIKIPIARVTMVFLLRVYIFELVQ